MERHNLIKMEGNNIEDIKLSIKNNENQNIYKDLFKSLDKNLNKHDLDNLINKIDFFKNIMKNT